MSLQLCSVCRGISADLWVWSNSLDTIEFYRGTKAELQSYNNMKVQSAKGCQLCTMFLDSVSHRVTDRNSCLYLWRDGVDHHQAINLGNGGILVTLYFFRVPKAWCKYNGLTTIIADVSGETSFARFNENIDHAHTMKTWLKTQLPRATKQFLPTRLIDIQAFPLSKDLRLVASRDIEAATAPPYFALSHCWGGVVPVQLRKEVLKEWVETGISFSKLPKTFQDAVRITSKLGFRYLWIDSMCIIQDSKEDWAQEASLMAGVYGNAYCTLAALSSKDSSEGCKITSNIQASLRSPYVEIEYKGNAAHPRIRLFKHMPRTWTEEFDGRPAESAAETSSPLRTRAWALQEKELSNCTIYFAKNQLLWENQTRRASSQLPWQEIEALKPSDTPRLMYVSSKGQIQGGAQSPWYDLVEDYTSRSLSFPGDKLVAFSGLAKMYSNLRSEYLAGIWSQDLPRGLLWRVSDSRATRTKDVAPSWSWASLIGAVTHDSLKMEPDKGYAHFEYPGKVYHGLKSLKVQATRMSLVDNNNPYEDVRDGRLILSGARCIQVDCGGIKAIQFSHGGQALLRYKRPIGVFFPDIASEAASVKKAYCIALHSESVIGLEYHGFRLKQDLAMTDMVMGIVVAKFPKSREYKRIGMARWVDELIFDSVQPTTIELV